MMQIKSLKLINTGFRLIVVIAFSMTVSCSDKEPANKTELANKDTKLQKPAESLRNFSVDSITRGALIFQERCAECHGPQAQGHPGWSPVANKKPGKKQSKKSKETLMVLAPPLDGNGVAHKRKKAQLVKVISQGIKRQDVQVMPQWKGRLSPEDIEDVITWFQALWPPKVYEAWNRVNQSTISSKRKP